MKLYNYVIIGVVFTILFSVFGFNTSASEFLAKFGLDNLSNLGNSALFTKLGLIFGVGAAGSLAIGTLSRTSPTYAIKAAYFMTPLIALIWDFVWILNKISSTGQDWLYWIFAIILLPFIAGYMITLLEFWEGRD